MNQRTREDGVAHLLAVVLIVAVLGVAGFAGYKVMQAGKNKDTGNNTAATGDAEDQAWARAGMAVEGKYADADVVQIEDGKWRLYYAIQPEIMPNNHEIYSATSTDGKTWTQESGTRKTMATFPEVVKLADGRYRMYYQNAGAIKSAISSDGLSFTDEAGTRMGKDNSEGLALDNVAAPAVSRQADGTYIMLYRGAINQRYATNTPNVSTNLYLWATSDDGLTFTQKGIAIDSRNSTLNGQLDGADLVKMDDGYIVYATTYTGVYSFSFDGSKFGEPVLAFAGEARKQGDNFMGQPPGDPTLAEINGTWYMYYGATGTDSGIHYATLQ